MIRLSVKDAAGAPASVTTFWVKLATGSSEVRRMEKPLARAPISRSPGGARTAPAWCGGRLRARHALDDDVRAVARLFREHDALALLARDLRLDGEFAPQKV